jgi:hypothetical protein
VTPGSIMSCAASEERRANRVSSQEDLRQEVMMMNSEST